MEAKTGGCKKHQPSTPAVSAATPAPPPSTRRPRVRQVSSRFMSPVSSSSYSAGDLHLLASNSPKHNCHQQRSVSAQRHRRQLKMADGDENRFSETAARSLDSPFALSKPPKEKSNRSDQLPTLSCTTHSKVFNSSVSSPLNRSLGSPLSSCNGRRESTSFSRMGLPLPPMPPTSKILAADTKKQRKVSEKLEEVQSLKLLHNRYLQWRFANANAEAKTQALKAQTVSMLYSFGLKISELKDSVQSKRIEFQRVSRVNALLAITESQTPCLEQWSAIQEEYSASLSQTIQALSNASLRLPLDTDTMVENNELAEALVVASKILDGITQNVGNYMSNSKAEEIERLVTELARVSSRGRSLTEECGLELLRTQASNIEECSLRSGLIQHQKKQESC